MPSLYIHIPFCERKCVYCDFYSIEELSSVDDFVRALHIEIESRAALGAGHTFETVFFGGGTPSLLRIPLLKSILEHVRSAFTVSPHAEVTLETNPGTITEEKLDGFRALGVNRLSIGVQSFRDDELRFLGRIHSSDEAVRCVRRAREAGFENISIDLIFSLPGQRRETWEENLRRGLSLEPEHISAYSLIVEDNTPLARMVQAGQVSPTPLEKEAELFECTMECMAAHGYEHYEVSNYARSGYRSRHNCNYWQHGRYLGFGPSAHSFWQHGEEALLRRWWNVRGVSAYHERLLKGLSSVAGEEVVTRNDLINERIFLGLRSGGLNVRELQREFGLEFDSGREEIVRQLIRARLALIEDGSLRLTSKGFLLCDEVSERLMVS